MLISVVVMGVAIIGVVLTSQPPPQNIPALDAVISWDGTDTIYIAHNGGDTLRRGEFYIQVDNEEKNFSKTNEPGNPSWSTWSAGESLDYKLVSPDPTPPRLVQVIYKGTSSAGRYACIHEFRYRRITIWYAYPGTDGDSPRRWITGDCRNNAEFGYRTARRSLLPVWPVRVSRTGQPSG